MSDITLRTAWRRNDPAQMEEAKAFWTRLNQVAEHLREQRANELGVLAYSGEQLVGVLTAELAMLPGLRARFAVCQGAMDPEFRRLGVSMPALGRLRAALEAWSLENPEEKVMGIAVVIEAQEYAQMQREPIWTHWGVDLTLIGYTPRNQQIRVSWFRHARL